MLKHTESPSIIKRIHKEITDLNSTAMEDIKIIIDDQDISNIQAVILGPIDTPFSGGEFRLKLTLGNGFPNEPPAAHFITKLFHPNVSPTTGEICLSTLKKDWNPSVSLVQLLITIKCLLIVPNAESALNEEAGKLLMEDYNEYKDRARLMTRIHAIKKPSANNNDEKSNADTNKLGTKRAGEPKNKDKKGLKRL